MMRFLLLALALMTATPVFAQQAIQAKGQPEPPKPLQQQMLAGGQVIYLGKHGSLNGWVLIRQGQPEFYYAPEDGSGLVMGILFDNEGRPITPVQITAIQEEAQRRLGNLVKPNEVPDAAPVTPTPAPAPTPVENVAPALAPAPAPAANLTMGAIEQKPQVAPSPARQLFNDVKNGAKLLWGREGAPVIYAFIDPNCVHCGRFMTDIQPFVDKGEIAVQILPAGFSLNSVNQAAFMMAASDGVERLLRYKNGEKEALPVDNADTTAVDHNMQILTDWDLRLTPVVIYETPKGDIRLVRGRPSDVQVLMKDALGQ